MSSKQDYSSIDAGNVEAETAVTDAVTMVEVEAPATLPGGYVFNASYEGNIFPVVVPDGGIKEGQKLAVPYKLDTVYGAVVLPTTIAGTWKDGICDWGAEGPCHPSLINACCCPLILLGQIMTRLKLDWLARPASDADFKQTFSTMVLIFVVYVVIDMVFGPTDPEQDVPIVNLTNFIVGLFILVITTQVRKIVRKKYEIPEERCIGCEDFCCAFWCGCCTVSQLARQTANYDAEEAAFFTNNGLVTSNVLVTNDGPESSTLTPVLVV